MAHSAPSGFTEPKDRIRQVKRPGALRARLVASPRGLRIIICSARLEPPFDLVKNLGVAETLIQFDEVAGAPGFVEELCDPKRPTASEKSVGEFARSVQYQGRALKSQ
jgi:hypothetical protein